jgi:uncharacterized secreted protein with C-terminal beta-propeller domain
MTEATVHSGKRPGWARKAAAGAALVTLAVGLGAPRAAEGATAPRRATPARVHLVHYGTCSQFLTAVKAEATREVGPDGLPGGSSFSGGPVVTGTAAPPGAAGPPQSAAPTASSGSPSGSTAATSPDSFSGTNDQETGVDEPDVTKTDGHLLLVLRHSPAGLEVADVSGSSPHLDAFLALPQLGWSDELLLTGSYAVVIGSGQWRPYGAEPYAAPGSQAVVISLADPRAPTVVHTYTFEGQEVGARLIAGRVLVVLQGRPDLPWVHPTAGTSQARAAAISKNRAVISRSALSEWMPGVRHSGSVRLASCAAALHPTVASGLDTVSVVSLDPTQSLPGTEVTVVGDAGTVYASTTALYVATTSWSEQMAPDQPYGGPASATTDLAGFDLTDASLPRYLGSGVVPGTLIGQYALSAYGGYLRVATTTGYATPPPNEGTPPAQQSDNVVSVLTPRNGNLVTVGSVGNLGRGEKIYAVRFVGPLGYVVTFRQTDPLYIVDLSDPFHPVAEGQLGLTGYSSFLQPLGGSLLLGVGQGVDSNVRQTGLQLSVFDVSNPSAPALRSRVDVTGANSTAESDPHALLWWPARRLVAMPVSQYSYSSTGTSGSGTSSSFNGVIVWHVAADGTLAEVARLSQPQSASPGPGPCNTCAAPAPQPASSGPAMFYPYYGAGIERAVVVGGLMYTVSDAGIMANDMDTWAQAAWLAFGSS